LAKKFTPEAIAKMGQLRELIWHRLRGKHPAAEQALEQAQVGEQAGIDTVATLLGVEMLDQEFAGQVQAIAQEIAKIIKDNSNVNQMSCGDKSPNIIANSKIGDITQTVNY
jgi:uncharacterized protein with von Willebrand factor type A (vWA) domain